MLVLSDINELERAFLQCWNDSGLNVLLSSQNKGLFPSFIGTVKYVSPDYFPSWQAYQLEEFQCNILDYRNVSLFFSYDNRLVAYWPLNLWIDKKNKLNFDSNFKAVLPPVFVADLNVPDKQKIQKKIFNCFENFLMASHVGDVFFEFPVGIESQFDHWYSLTLNRSVEASVKNEIGVDLHQEIKVIRSNIRKSYKSLINKSGILNIQILPTCTMDQWTDFHLLHQFVAGSKTRSDETWRLQYEMVRNNEAFLVQIRDVDTKLLGGAFIRHSKNEGIYGSGVYDRRFSNLSLGHLAQWAAIKHLKVLGVTYHRLGIKSEPTDTKKISDISKFKQGFGNLISPVITNHLFF